MYSHAHIDSNCGSNADFNVDLNVDFVSDELDVDRQRVFALLAETREANGQETFHSESE